MSDMADVLREHELAIDYAEYFACTCGTIQSTTNGHHPEHQAASLSAAGFGPVQEARAEAWEAGKNAVWTFMSNQDPRRERPTNPYRTEASS